jgi:hypothetical protein
LSFRRVVEDMCRRADAVVVGSDAQLDHVKPLCANVVRILDIHTDSLGWRKTDYRASDTFHICWEGYPALEGLSMVLPALRRVAAKYKLCLHFVTNGKRYRLRNHFPRDVRQLLAGLCNGMQWFMYDWNSFMTSRILTACDLAIIPLARNDRFSSGKGANKLLFFWQLGIPVVTSAIQSYMDEMHACGTLAYCHNEQQWYAMIERYISSEGDRRNAAEQAARYVDEKYSDQCLVEQWDRLVGQLLR